MIENGECNGKDCLECKEFMRYVRYCKKMNEFVQVKQGRRI